MPRTAHRSAGLQAANGPMHTGSATANRSSASGPARRRSSACVARADATVEDVCPRPEGLFCDKEGRGIPQEFERPSCCWLLKDVAVPGDAMGACEDIPRRRMADPSLVLHQLPGASPCTAGATRVRGRTRSMPHQGCPGRRPGTLRRSSGCAIRARPAESAPSCRGFGPAGTQADRAARRMASTSSRDIPNSSPTTSNGSPACQRSTIAST